MRKGNLKKVVGVISNDIIERYKLYDFKDKKIVQSLNLYLHIAKHISEFISVDSCNHDVSNILQIILRPDFVYYDNKKSSLLYFKEIDENVCVVVKLNIRKNKDTYVASVYPVSKTKIERCKERSYIINR